MAFLRSSLTDHSSFGFKGLAVALRPPVMQDFEAWAQLRAASRDHLQPFEPRWADDELTRQAFRRRLRIYARDRSADEGYAFFIFRISDDVLLGGLTLSNVRRGVSQAAAVGYWVGVHYRGQGVMTDAVKAAVSFAFENLNLHRLEAACLPHNLASLRVLEKAGFLTEGYAHQYLKIDGRWQDHVLLGLVEGGTRRGAV